MAPCETCGKQTDLIDELFDEAECQSCKDNRAERAYDRAMERAMEGADLADEWYRRQLKEAGR